MRNSIVSDSVDTAKELYEGTGNAFVPNIRLEMGWAKPKFLREAIRDVQVFLVALELHALGKNWDPKIYELRPRALGAFHGRPKVSTCVVWAELSNQCRDEIVLDNCSLIWANMGGNRFAHKIIEGNHTEGLANYLDLNDPAALRYGCFAAGPGAAQDDSPILADWLIG